MNKEQFEKLDLILGRIEFNLRPIMQNSVEKGTREMIEELHHALLDEINLQNGWPKIEIFALLNRVFGEFTKRFA